MSILIVDDSQLNLAYLRDVLIEAGYDHIQTADSAHKALEILGLSDGATPRRAAAVDLILLDVVMPGMDGIAACRLIKSSPVYVDLPIIFLTGTRDAFKEAFSAGGMDFIEKGSPTYELLARVQSALRLKKEMDIRKTRENRVRKELQLAKQVQKSVLSLPITDPCIHIHGKYIQSDEVSGDMFYWVRLDDSRYALLLIDVSGHGLSSALISMSVRSSLEGIVAECVSPDLVFTALNKLMTNLFGNNKSLKYFTAIYLLIDITNKTIDYFNAGHPPGIVFAQDQSSVYLEGTNIPIGIKKEVPGKTKRVRYDTPTRIVLYTDGLVETPGLSIKSGIEEFEKRALEANSLDNQMFIDTLAELGQDKSDDVCIVSIHLI